MNCIFPFQVEDDNDLVENGELEKLSPEPKTRDASTCMSQERLSSLMIKYNQIGSLTSLPRGSRVSPLQPHKSFLIKRLL